ncbi:hypothetical protein IDG69_15340, partial [Staphylococcus sp. EG-SA-23]|nr:hypothetical protein [Staphylococcus sp. EG-SA-23]
MLLHDIQPEKAYFELSQINVYIPYLTENHQQQAKEKQDTGDSASEDVQDNLFVLNQMEREVTGSGVFIEWV